MTYQAHDIGIGGDIVWISDSGGTIVERAALSGLSPMLLWEVAGFNATSTETYLQLFDAIAYPESNATNFVFCMRIPASCPNFGRVFHYGHFFGHGICWVCSSTAEKYTRLTGGLLRLEMAVSL